MNRLRIRSLGILSVAKMYAAMGLIIGLIIGIMYGVIIIIYSLFGASLVKGEAALYVAAAESCLGSL